MPEAPMPEPIHYAAREIAMVMFLRDLIHPEQYGHAVSKEVRDRAKELLAWIGGGK